MNITKAELQTGTGHHELPRKNWLMQRAQPSQGAIGGPVKYNLSPDNCYRRNVTEDNVHFVANGPNDSRINYDEHAMENGSFSSSQPNFNSNVVDKRPMTCPNNVPCGNGTLIYPGTNGTDFNISAIEYANGSDIDSCHRNASAYCGTISAPAHSDNYNVSAQPDMLMSLNNNGDVNCNLSGVKRSMANLPCQQDQDWNYDQCYNYYAYGCYNTCQFVQMGDMEDFMNNEKRKEKSRNAARSRRSRESEIFTDLGNALPLPADQVDQLDKASVMRLAISYLRVRDMLKLVPNVNTKKKNKKVKTEGSVFLKSLEGFVMVLSQDGDFIYLSENISEYLGITQIDLMGQSVYEYSHPCDHDEVKDILSAKVQENTHNPVSCFLRLKCTLTNKGRSVNLKSATYKVIHCTGHMLYTEECSTTDDTANINKCFIAIGQIIPHPSNIETPLPTQTFLTKHSLDMKFTYADEKMFDFLGYKSEDLVGKSVYEYHHAMDSEFISSAYKCLFSKGQCETIRYRFLGKKGGYVWVATQGTLIYDKNNKPYSVVCVNYVISGIECEDDIYAAFQLNSAIKSEEEIDLRDDVLDDLQLLTPPLSANSSPRSSPGIRCSSIKPSEDIDSKLTVVPLAYPPPPLSLPSLAPRDRDSKPKTVTDKLFADIVLPSPISSRPQSTTTKHFNPRTADMSKGFVMFSKEEPGLTLMKDDNLDDLTHLAPVAGDACIPLDDYFSSDMYLLNNEHLIHNYSPLLTDEPADPFMDSCDTSPQILSPNISKHSESSLHSLNSPTESALGDEDMFISMDDDADLLLKAPYIPMSMSDDLPLFMPDGFGLSGNSSPFSTDKDGIVSKDMDNSPTLSELLQAGVTKGTGSVKSVDTGGGGGRNIIASDDYCNTIKSNWANLQINKSPPTPIRNILEANIPHNQSRPNQKSNATNRATTNTNKRLSNTRYASPNKRTKADSQVPTARHHGGTANGNRGNNDKDPAKMTNQLLEQLINVQSRNGAKNRSTDWLLDSHESVGRKAACVVSQPSESVLMNLLPEQQEICCSRKKEPPLSISSKVSDKGVIRDLPPLLYPLHMAYALMDSEDSRDENIVTCHRNVQQREECAARANTIRKNSFSLLDPEMETIPSLLDLTEQDYEVNAPVNRQLLQGEELINALENQSI